MMPKKVPPLTWGELLIRAVLFLWEVVKYPFEPTFFVQAERLNRDPVGWGYKSVGPYVTVINNHPYAYGSHGCRRVSPIFDQELRLRQAGSKLDRTSALERQLRKRLALNARTMRFRSVDRDNWK